MKKALMLIILFLCIFPSYVLAIDLCGYNMKSGSNNINLSISYSENEQKFQLRIEKGSHDYITKSGTYNEVFKLGLPNVVGPNTYINDIQYFVCPEYATYSETSNSICFGFNESSCSAYLSTSHVITKTQDIATDVANYVLNKLPIITSNSDNAYAGFKESLRQIYLSSYEKYFGSLSLSDKLKDKIKENVDKSFEEKIREKIRQYKSDCDQKYLNGEIDEDQYKYECQNLSENIFDFSKIKVSNDDAYTNGFKSSPNANQNSNSNIGSGTVDMSPSLQNCESLLGSPTNPKAPAYFINKAFKVLRYAAIIVLIVFSIFDFVSAITSNDEAALKKAVSKTIKRAIICVIIFLLPLLIELLLKYLDDKATSLCGIER